MRYYNWTLLAILILTPVFIFYLLGIIIWNYTNDLSTFDVLCNTGFLIVISFCGVAMELLIPMTLPIYMEIKGTKVRFHFLFRSLDGDFDIWGTREIYIDSVVEGKRSPLVVVYHNNWIKRFEGLSFNMKSAIYSLRDEEKVRIMRNKYVVGMREKGSTLKKPPSLRDLEKDLSRESIKLAREGPEETSVQDRKVLQELESLERDVKNRQRK